MHYLLIMHMLERTGDLPHVLPDSGLIKRIIISRMFFDQLLKISFLGPFGHYVKFIIFNKRVDVFDYVWMIEWFH